MSFALTKYIFPLKDAVILSPLLGYTLDNPRTEEEINIIKKCITSSITEKEQGEDTTAPLRIRFISSLNQLCEDTSKIQIDAEYLLHYHSTNQAKSYIDCCAAVLFLLFAVISLSF